MLEAGADSFAGAIPTILKVNSSNSLSRDKEAPSQALTGSVGDALRLGCAAIGFTIYPGSDAQFEMMGQLRAMAEDAKTGGLAVAVWSYPRAGPFGQESVTAGDTWPSSPHMAAPLGTHISTA